MYKRQNLTVILVFGGATIWLHSDVFIKWKPTVLYWLFGGALVFARLLFGRNLIRRLMEKQIQLPDAAWDKLNLISVSYTHLDVYKRQGHASPAARR